MKFLLTNDDGVTAPGLWAAASALAEVGQVLIVAPSGNCSGYGPAYPPGQVLSWFPYRNGSNHPAGVTAYGLSATPATCAHVGLSGVFGMQDFDLVVSGVNEGANIGRDVFYSGTVGAALTAHFLGRPAIAISLAVQPGQAAHWDSARQAVREVVALWREDQQRGYREVFYNVNVPNRVVGDLRGLRVAGLSGHSFLPASRFEQAPNQPNQVLIRRVEDCAPAGHALWSDAWAIEQGHVSITPLKPAHNALPADLCDVPAAWCGAGDRSCSCRTEAG